MFTNAASPVRAAFLLWMLALTCGIFETTLVILDGEVSGTELLIGVTIRIVVTLLAVYVALKMLAGRNWARIALALLLGIVGMLSLVVDPIRDLAAGHSLADLMSPAFAASRLIHTIAVLTATALMFTPAANGYFKAFKARQSNGFSSTTHSASG